MAVEKLAEGIRLFAVDQVKLEQQIQQMFEGYTTKAAWEMTDMFHIKAIEIIGKSLRSAVANEKEGREGMALGEYARRCRQTPPAGRG